MVKKSKYSHLSREQLEAKLEKLEQTRHYGLVWEDKEEDVAKQCEVELPVLEEDTSREILKDASKNYNFIIEGDNYHSLYTLNFTHKKKIDVIYIDPPYNTGNRSWKYNNDYIDKEDSYRHSKWLSFMSKRLRLSRQLLSNNGILICAIDDYEFAGLKLLLDDIFGEQNRLGTLVVVHNPRGRNDDKFFASQHEYLLVYAKNSCSAIVNDFSLDEIDKSQYSKEDNISAYAETSFIRTGNNSKREERPNLYYPIYYNESEQKLSLTRHNNQWEELLPINNKGEERCWRWGKETFMELSETELFVKKIKGVSRIYKKRRLKDHTGKRPKTIWNSSKYDASSNGIILLQKIFKKNNTFNYPKSLFAVQDILEITSNKNSIVLDFFAGSGTTAHAVLELNKKDKGNRQFILCTNNESNICEEVTFPRVQKVINGYSDQEGIPANVKYFKQTFVPTVTSDQGKRELVNRSTELLCMAENTFESVMKRSKKDDFAIFKSSTQQTVIIYDEECIDKCVSRINEMQTNLKTIIYTFSYDHTYEVEDFENLRVDFVVKPIPEAILNTYRKISKMRKK